MTLPRGLAGSPPRHRLVFLVLDQISGDVSNVICERSDLSGGDLNRVLAFSALDPRRDRARRGYPEGFARPDRPRTGSTIGGRRKGQAAWSCRLKWA